MRYASYRQRNRRLRIRLVCLLILAVVLFFCFELKMRPVIEQSAKNSAHCAVNALVNETVGDYIESSGLKYEQLIQITYGTDRSVKSLECDTIALGRLITAVNMDIIKGINECTTGEISVHAGTLLGGDFSRGRGPLLHSRFDMTGTAESVLESSFTSAGLNQTKHRLLLKVCVRVNLLIPYCGCEHIVTLKLPIAETVIVGQLPGSYTTVDLSKSSLYNKS